MLVKSLIRVLIFLTAIFMAHPLLLASEEVYSGWKTAESEHFKFIFEERDRKSVEELLSFCEDVYDRVTAYFESYPKKVVCIIHGRIDTANGYFSSFPSALHLYVTSPTEPWIGSKTENWLKILLIHELTHYIHLTYQKGVVEFLSRIFGRHLRVIDSVLMPGWMVEGIATNFETMFTKGGRGRNPFFEMIYKAFIMEGDLFTLKQAGYSSSYPPQNRIYVAGYLLINYMMERFGDDVLLRITREFARFPFLGPAYSIRKVTGETVRQIFGGMKWELEQKYLKEYSASGGKIVSPAGIGNYHLPRITDDGWYLYRSTLDKPPALVLFHPETGDEDLLVETSLTDYSSYTVAAGKQIVFATYKSKSVHPAGSILTSDLYSYDLRTKKIKRITRGAHLWQPAISKNGGKLVAVQKAGPYSRLVEVDLKTGKPKLLFSMEEANVYNPVFSPDGEKIAFVLNHKGVQDIWIIEYSRPDRAITEPDPASFPKNFNADRARPLTGPDTHGEYFPTFLDNYTILFSSDRDGSLSLYTLDISQNKITPLWSDPVAAYAGDISSESLVYASYSSMGYLLKSVSKDELPELKAVQSDAANISGISVRQNPTGSVYGYTDSQANVVPAGDLESRAYLDFPKPLYWLPVPFYFDPLFSQGLIPGAGIYSYGNSNLGKASWSMALTSRFDVFQPGIDLSIYLKPWILSLTYRISQSYLSTEQSGSYQLMAQSFSLGIPLVEKYWFNTGTAFSIHPGIQHQYLISSERDFSFPQIFGSSGMERQNRLFGFGTARFSMTKARAPKDFFPLKRAFISLYGDFPIPVFPGTEPGYRLRGTFSLSIPSPVPHHVIKPGIKISYTTPNLLGYKTITGRGIFDPEEQETTVRALGALDYLYSIALLDVPLPFGFNLQGIGGGIHFEGTAGFDPEKLNIIMDYIYTGVELIFNVGTPVGGILPLGAGVSIRFDPSFERTFNIYRDLRPYFFLSLDSFLDAGFSHSAADFRFFSAITDKGDG